MLAHGDVKIAVIGLGYVGLPLAVAFGVKRNTIGFDINKARIDELSAGIDSTLEISKDELAQSVHLTVTCDEHSIKDANIYIITVPTPITSDKKPDLRPILSASKMVGSMLNQGDIVIYESTVYPGCTEEDCVPILEQESGLAYKKDFHCGYSPERINPGDKNHRLSQIVKVTSGSTDAIADIVDGLYKEIVSAGTYKAESIKVAEAAKVIENTQRDVNIALINELSQLFEVMGLDTEAVLKAAETKWNFLPFRPGLVGGHCIGVDPYYLTHKAQSIGHEPAMILAGRQINDGMGDYVAEKLLDALRDKDIKHSDANILIMGLTFKENCPDMRNTRVIDIIENLQRSGCHVDVFDPWVSAKDALFELGVDLIEKPKHQFYHGVVICVGHQVFSEADHAPKNFTVQDGLIFDLKYILPRSESDFRL